MGEEMNYSLEYYFYFFSSFYLTVYVFAAIIFLSGTTFLKEKYKTESYNLLYVFNTLAAWCVPLGLGFYFIELFVAWYGQNPYEWYAFETGDTSQVSWWWWIIKTAVPLFFGLLLFFRKLRINRAYTLFFLLLLNIGFIERLIYYFSKDYLPLSWAVYPTSISGGVTKYAMMLCFLLLIYFIAKKKNKLPYPSVFLK
jgi:hypothetical protein